MSDKKLQVVPLGGLGEFGMNMTAFCYGDDIIVVDSGMMFPDSELLGVDLVMPDITFLKERREHVRALILIVDRVRRLFDLRADPSEIHAQLTRDPLLAGLRPGLRSIVMTTSKRR